MLAVVIVCSILSILCLIIALLLSRSGSSGGLASIGGQDLEIFKKTKDRGWIKGLQILLFMMTVILVIIAITVYFTTSGSQTPEAGGDTTGGGESTDPNAPATFQVLKNCFLNIIHG